MRGVGARTVARRVKQRGGY